jgi:hypothetical protein
MYSETNDGKYWVMEGAILAKTQRASQGSAPVPTASKVYEVVTLP